MTTSTSSSHHRWRNVLIVLLLLLLALILWRACNSVVPKPDTQADATPTAVAASAPSGTQAVGCPAPLAAPVSVPPMVVADAPVAVPQTPPALPVVPVESGGFLDLPFPHDGSPRSFARASNPTGYNGGHINGYLDHEFPVYPVRWNGMPMDGVEPASAPDMLLFDGSRERDQLYTGHPAYDFAPIAGQLNSTPVLAAADGFIAEVTIWNDGNHLVKINHPITGVGTYQTWYLHLQPDSVWERTLTRFRAGGGRSAPVKAGERIGTMGTTGLSTGVHLHFEVRFDANGDGAFSPDEVVDPYGFLGSDDPWSHPATFQAASGARSYRGSRSRYLWKYPLGQTFSLPTGQEQAQVGVALGGGGGQGEAAATLTTCPTNPVLPPNSYLLASWAPDEPPGALNQAVASRCQAPPFDAGPPDPAAVGVIGLGRACVVEAFDSQGKAITAFTNPLKVTLTYDPTDVQDVDPGSLKLYMLNPQAPAGKQWEAMDTTIDAASRSATALFPRPGKCALMGKAKRDLIAPKTSIVVEGKQIEGNLYEGDVTVRMCASDAGGSGVAGIAFSRNLGDTWQNYAQPIVVHPGDPKSRGTKPALAGTPETVAESFGDLGDYVFIARAGDEAGNQEQPEAIVGFSIEVLASPTPTEVPTAAPTPTFTAVPTATEVPTAGPTNTPTCVEDSEFVADLTVSDDTVFQPRTSFVKTWRLRNAGTCDWPVDTRLAFESGAQLAAARQVLLPRAVPPGQNIDVSVNMIAPPTPGTYISTWRLRNSTGAPFGAPIYVRIVVAEPPAVTVTVPPPQPDQPYVIRFWADRTDLTGGCTLLHWLTSDIDSVYLDNKGVVGSGDQQVCPQATTTYTLRVLLRDRSEQRREVTVTVPPPQPDQPYVIRFWADPPQIKACGSTTLQWQVEGVNSVYLDNRGVAGNGSQQVSPQQTTTYTLRVVLRDGTEQRQQVTVPVTPPTVVFRADSETLTFGQSTMLHWQVEGVREVYLDEQGVAGSGSQQVSPRETTTYTLRVVMCDGTEQRRQVTVGVTAEVGGVVVKPLVAPPPAAPSRLTCSNDSPGSEFPVVKLEWKNNASDASEIRIEQLRSGGAWGEIARVQPTNQQYIDNGLYGTWNSEKSPSYRLRVYRSRDDRYSAYSNVAACPLRR